MRTRALQTQPQKPTGGTIHAKLAAHPPGARVETAPPIARAVLRSPGEPLDLATRALMEPRFGHDFSRVRVHVDSQALASARDMGALAYTLGRDIVFAQGQFNPHTTSGQRLLAHELAHTVQQGAGPEQLPAGDLRVGRPNDPLELEAENIATSVMSARVGESPGKLASASLGPDRQPALRRRPSPDARVPEHQPLPPKEEGVKGSAPVEPVCKSPSNIPLPCSPKALADADFMKAGAPRNAVGWTHKRDGAGFEAPEVHTKPAGKSNVVVEKTTATPLPCESIFTKAGRASRTIRFNPDKPAERENSEKCRGGTYDRQFTITSGGEKKIKEAEMEHCTDYKHAFDISIGCYAAVVNKLARSKTEFPSQEAAEDAVTKSAGLKPDAWTTRYVELLEKSAQRDTNEWHTPKPIGDTAGISFDVHGRCTLTPVEINEQAYSEVGKHPTSDLIK